MTQSLRIVFAGTPEFAACHLAALLQSPHQIIGVYTQPDRPSGRGQKKLASAVKQLALSHHLPVFQPLNLKDQDAQYALAALKADLLVVVAYGLILPPAVLAIPRLGCINSHASLLPRWRGAAPIQRAIEAGDEETGITVMQMEAGLDSGPMLLKVKTPIFQSDTALSLYQRLAAIGPPALLQAIEGLAAGRLSAEVQDERLACYAHKLQKEQGAVDWSRPALELQRRIRAFTPVPGSCSTLSGQRIKILAAELASGQGAPSTVLSVSKEGLLVACGEGALRLTHLQLPGGKPLAFAEIINSRREQFAVNMRFDS